MKSNTSGNYTIAIKGTFEEVQLKNGNESLRTQTIKLIGQRVDIRSGMYLAMVQDKNFAQLICHAAEYYKSVKEEYSPSNKSNVKETTSTPRKNAPTKRKG
jgi:hypothetical protein